MTNNTDNSRRLTKCFSLVFPQIPAAEIELLSVHSLPEWDSLASIQLVCVLEETFDIELDNEQIENLDSFELILDHINNVKP